MASVGRTILTTLCKGIVFTSSKCVHVSKSIERREWRLPRNNLFRRAALRRAPCQPRRGARRRSRGRARSRSRRPCTSPRRRACSCRRNRSRAPSRAAGSTERAAAAAAVWASRRVASTADGAGSEGPGCTSSRAGSATPRAARAGTRAAKSRWRNRPRTPPMGTSKSRRPPANKTT